MDLHTRWFGLACATLLMACTTSEGDVSENDGGTGTGGSATGGSAGSATGGSAGSATGGSAGSATGGSAGSATGGSAGSATGGSAGSATGGSAGNAGSGATGGTGGGSTTARCDDLCADIVAANCEEGPTLQGCLLTCKALTSSSACDDDANDYFDCTDSATFECDAKGDPVAPGCGVKYLVAINCAVTENPNPAIVAPCEDYCDAIAAASCPSNGTKEDCNTNCLWLGATGTGCDDEWSTYLDCANSVTLSCMLGYAVAVGCGPDWQAYRACIDAAGGT